MSEFDSGFAMPLKIGQYANDARSTSCTNVLPDSCRYLLHHSWLATHDPVGLSASSGSWLLSNHPRHHASSNEETISHDVPPDQVVDMIRGQRAGRHGPVRIICDMRRFGIEDAGPDVGSFTVVNVPGSIFL